MRTRPRLVSGHDPTRRAVTQIGDRLTFDVAPLHATFVVSAQDLVAVETTQHANRIVISRVVVLITRAHNVVAHPVSGVARIVRNRCPLRQRMCSLVGKCRRGCEKGRGGGECYE